MKNNILNTILGIIYLILFIYELILTIINNEYFFDKKELYLNILIKSIIFNFPIGIIYFKNEIFFLNFDLIFILINQIISIWSLVLYILNYNKINKYYEACYEIEIILFIFINLRLLYEIYKQYKRKKIMISEYENTYSNINDYVV